MTSTSAAPPVSGRRAATRERLMNAAVGVFAERGIIGASVEEICEAAGFTRGAFYSNFADKDELVLAMLRLQMEHQYAAAQAAIDVIAENGPRGDPDAVLTAALDTLEHHLHPEREWVLAQHELLLYAARRPAVRDAYREFSDGYLEQFGALIARGVEASGLSLAIPFGDALELLTSCHVQDQLDRLFDQGGESRRLRILLRLLTRPAG
ncbi:AcrR family transcriptional regulator [Friedmanniella endophytica]|uniref:AcrR family transcriptional regulator n=1 Tax=Microlunatus kandeliicorticis TaxID=1759536 RepID=A0A7W3P529_9ACTN|nr:TetR/AcrR family transcriptional regulator [Microlunatus kandeliicorticis]MBA8793528.1 AcrR family transcriptional regulator [Microlunatus kandeliicorticis]